MTKPISIIGIGNLLMMDEGVGVHAIRALEKENLPDNCELIDAAVPGLSLLYMIENRRLAIIIDCADFGGKAGDVRAFNAMDLVHTEMPMASLHATDVLQTLKLAEQMGSYPERAFIIGVQPLLVQQGQSLSPQVSRSLDEVTKCVFEIIGASHKVRIAPRLRGNDKQ